MIKLDKLPIALLLLAVACDGGDKTEDSTPVPDDDTGEAPYRDEDGDGYYVEVDDCDDQDPDVNPGATETCDGLDNNCDSQIDEGVTNLYYLDGDGDGYGSAETPVQDCALPQGASAEAGDCDDVDAAVNPLATETCDGLDNDCDGLTDAEDEVEGGTFTAYTDADGDGYGDAAAPVTVCALGAGAVADSTDCDDTQASTYPGAAEICPDALDQDCDGLVDELCGDCADLNIIQLYDSYSYGTTPLEGAATALGATLSSVDTYYDDVATVYDALHPEEWDVVVVDVPGSPLSSDAVTRIETAIDAGSLVLVSYWYLHYEATTASLLGVTTDTLLLTPPPLTNATGATLWDYSQDLPDVISGAAYDAGFNGATMTPVDASTSETLAVVSDDDGEPIILSTYGGQVIVNGFLPWDFQSTDDDADGTLDMVELYVNEIKWALGCAP